MQHHICPCMFSLFRSTNPFRRSRTSSNASMDDVSKPIVGGVFASIIHVDSCCGFSHLAVSGLSYRMERKGVSPSMPYDYAPTHCVELIDRYCYVSLYESKATLMILGLELPESDHRGEPLDVALCFRVDCRTNDRIGMLSSRLRSTSCCYGPERSRSTLEINDGFGDTGLTKARMYSAGPACRLARDGRRRPHTSTYLP